MNLCGFSIIVISHLIYILYDKVWLNGSVYFINLGNLFSRSFGQNTKIVKTSGHSFIVVMITHAGIAMSTVSITV